MFGKFKSALVWKIVLHSSNFITTESKLERIKHKQKNLEASKMISQLQDRKHIHFSVNTNVSSGMFQNYVYFIKFKQILFRVESDIQII